jgi:hypothetical protein
MENVLIVSKRIRRIRGKYLSLHGEYGKFRIVNSTHNRFQNLFGECAERIYAYMEKTQRDSWHILLIRQETQN